MAKQTKNKKKRNWLKWVFWIVLSPFILCVIAGIVVYIPPVQQWLVNTVASSLTEGTGVDVKVEKIRLSFPLDLAVNGIVATDKGDTLADIRALKIEVQMWPLLKGKVEVDGLGLYDAELNTRDWIPDTYIRGHVGKLTASSHGIALSDGKVTLNHADLLDADVFVALSDTGAVAEEDTVPTPWAILVEKVNIEKTKVRLSLPGDSMRLGLDLGKVNLRDGNIDLLKGDYTVRHFSVLDGGVSYAARTIGTSEKVGNTAFMISDDFLWKDFEVQSSGLDPNYIDISHLNFDFSDCAYLGNGDFKATLKALKMQERSGLKIKQMKFGVASQKNKLKLSDFSLRTPYSSLSCDLEFHPDALETGSKKNIWLNAAASLGPEDIKTSAQAFVDKELLNLWPESPLHLNADCLGNWDGVVVDTFAMKWQKVMDLEMKGEMMRPALEERKGKVDFNLHTAHLDFIRDLLDMNTEKVQNLPSDLSLKGVAKIDGSDCSLVLDGHSGKGKLAANCGVNLKTEGYRADMSLVSFPLHAFAPAMGLRDITLSLKGDGRGFDLMRPSARLKADVSLDSLFVNHLQMGGVKLTADLDKGKGTVGFESNNDILEGEGTIETLIDKKNLTVALRSNLPGINMKNILGLKDTLFIGMNFNLDAYTNQKMTAYGVSGAFKNLRFLTAKKGIPAKNLYFSFDTSSDSTALWTSAGDMEAKFATPNDLEGLASQVNVLLDLLEYQASTKNLNQANLKKVSPELDFHLKAGTKNPLASVLKNMGYAYSSLELDVVSEPSQGLRGDFNMGGLQTGGLRLDTIRLDLRHDTTGLVANGWVKNYKKRNPNKFEVSLKSYLLDKGGAVQLVFLDKDGKKGIDLGILAEISPEHLNFHFYPEHPVIAYRKFTVNKNNFISLGQDSTLRADVDLLADDQTGLRIYGMPNGSSNDLTVSLNRVNLSDLSEVLPYLPKLGGLFSGDIHMVDEHKTLSAVASMQVSDFVFEGAALGNLGLEAIYMPEGNDTYTASAFVSSEGTEVMSLEGSYVAKGKGSFTGKAELLDFPLKMVNGFLVGTDVAMSGTAAGFLNVSSDGTTPKVDGRLQFSEARLISDVYGFNLKMDDKPVLFADNQLVLDDYGLYSYNNTNPLTLNGVLDMSNPSKILMDFKMKARNFELINTKKTKQSLLFGKVYADFDGTLKGSIDDMFVWGKLSVLDRTNMTYILKDSPLSVDDRLQELVQFVNFTDSVEVTEKKPVPTNKFDMTMAINISDAAVFHCNLSENGENYIDLEGGGDLIMRLTQQGDMRMTGRFTANDGKMKYSLPIIPLKTFTLVPGSYVEFTGDVANPTLNIAATERMKTMVTENDQPRSVAFDVGVSITQPLDRMGLEFTIDAPEDLAMQNQLASMAKAERGKAAVGMLATGMFFTDANMSNGNSGFKASNALTTFLQSEIQNIAGNALKTIDVSIGMENNTSEVGTTTTDYSFQFAKRFWNNRFSVIIGGKVSTGSDAENSAESFIDNVALEYRLDKTASRYVRLFYERSAHDPLEGQLSKTGAGLVLRRKSYKLGDLFIFRTRKSEDEVQKK